MINKYLFFFLISAVLAAFSQILLKYASMNSNKDNRSVLFEILDWRVIFAYILLLSTTAFNILGFKENSLAMGTIINSLSFLFVGTLSIKLFKENFTKISIIGYIFIFLGVVIAVL